MGCSLASSLVAGIKEFRKTVSPDYLFVEPSELVVTAELRSVISMGLRDINYDIGPFITLVNAEDFAIIWEERRPLILGQISGADLVAISKVDLLIGKPELQHIVNTIKTLCPCLLQLSSHNALGIKEVITSIG